MANIRICFLLSIIYNVYAAPVSQIPGQTSANVAPQVDEIARAYAAGYKAALFSVQARSSIPRAPAHQIYTPRSLIPQTPQFPSNIQGIRSNPAFNFPPARQITANGIEKSGIPRPVLNRPAVVQRSNQVSHTMVERSAPLVPPFLGQFMNQQHKQPSVLQQRSTIPKPEDPKVTQQKRNKIVKLNAAARHRNVYLDSMGGDPYGGSSGVLTRQHFWLNRKHKRSAESDEEYERFRRSRAPYLGQDLDKFGIIRANPNYNAPAITKASFMNTYGTKVPDPQAAPAVYPQQYNPGYSPYTYPQNRPYYSNLYSRGNIVQSNKYNDAGRNRNIYLNSMRGVPYVSAQKVAPIVPVYHQPAAYAAYPQYRPYNNNLFARGNIVPSKVPYAPIVAPNRNVYPSNPMARDPYAYYRMLQASKQYQQYPQQLRMAKRQAKQEDIAKMNRAARHRNVYLDSMGGDPYDTLSEEQ